MTTEIEFEYLEENGCMMVTADNDITNDGVRIVVHNKIDAIKELIKFMEGLDIR